MELSKHWDSGSYSNDSHNRRFWKYLWKIPIPHKIRHFAWRACRDILPTKANLVRRRAVG